MACAWEFNSVLTLCDLIKCEKFEKWLEEPGFSARSFHACSRCCCWLLSAVPNVPVSPLLSVIRYTTSRQARPVTRWQQQARQRLSDHGDTILSQAVVFLLWYSMYREQTEYKKAMKSSIFIYFRPGFKCLWWHACCIADAVIAFMLYLLA